MSLIRTVAAVIENTQGEVLLVRKRASSIFIQPGGKIEADEDPLAALARELEEELAVELELSEVVFLGQFEDEAVNEPGCRVRALAYRCAVRGFPVAQSEIEELVWVRPEGPFAVPVAALSALHILPAHQSSDPHAR